MSPRHKGFAIFAHDVLVVLNLFPVVVNVPLLSLLQYLCPIEVTMIFQRSWPLSASGKLIPCNLRESISHSFCDRVTMFRSFVSVNSAVLRDLSRHRSFESK
jgi:hypothetical protein